MSETMKLPAFAQEDYYLNKKADEANEKAELFKQATICGEDGISCTEYKVCGKHAPFAMELIKQLGKEYKLQ